MPLDAAKPTLEAVGSYDLLQKIADGGMGSVYKGKHRLSGDIVAVKVVPAHLASNKILCKRLEQEYNAAKNLDHPNIVRALEFGVVEGSPYLVMEFVDGESLGQKIERDGRLSEVEAIRIIAQVAQGLHKAHKSGLVHRDVKPDNVLITRDGQAKLADLGLVKELETDLNLTRTGRGLGTPHFMSPEQFRNAKNADVRCDIYSLGATLYQMVTGELPFKSCGPLDAWMKKIHNELAAPREVIPELSQRIDWAIRRAMSPDPQQRPSTCREFLEDVTGQSTRKMTTVTGQDTQKSDLWYLVYKDEEGVTHTVKGSLAGIRRSLKEGLLGDATNVRVSQSKTGPFEMLRHRPEFRDLVVNLEAYQPPVKKGPAQPATTRIPTPAPTQETAPMMNTKTPPGQTPAPPPMPNLAPPPSVFMGPALPGSYSDQGEWMKMLILIALVSAAGLAGFFLMPILAHIRF